MVFVSTDGFWALLTSSLMRSAAIRWEGREGAARRAEQRTAELQRSALSNISVSGEVGHLQEAHYALLLLDHYCRRACCVEEKPYYPLHC